MVDQALLIQEAKRALHNPKHWDQFTQELDKHWKEVELPQLENQFAAEDEHQLREKFKERGRSLDVHYQSFRRMWMAENFLHAKLKNRLKADLPELLKYYEDHKRDAVYDRPDQIVWHEIVVEARRYPSRDEARKKAGVILDRLRHGADFARLAQAESEGPSRSRDEGGLMETSPGSYGVTAVNDALLALPIGQVSGILEGRTELPYRPRRSPPRCRPRTVRGTSGRDPHQDPRAEVPGRADRVHGQAPAREPHRDLPRWTRARTIAEQVIIK